MLDNRPPSCEQALNYILRRFTSRKVDKIGERLLDVLKGRPTTADDSTYLA